MVSEHGQQIITILILPNISRSKGNQKMLSEDLISLDFG